MEDDFIFSTSDLVFDKCACENNSSECLSCSNDFLSSFRDEEDDKVELGSVLWELNPLYSCSFANSSSRKVRGILFRKLCDSALDFLAVLYKPNICINVKQSVTSGYNPVVHSNKVGVINDTVVCESYVVNSNSELITYESNNRAVIDKKLYTLDEVEQLVTALVVQIEEYDNPASDSSLIFGNELINFVLEIDDFFSNTYVTMSEENTGQEKKDMKKSSKYSDREVICPPSRASPDTSNVIDPHGLIVQIAPQRKRKSVYRKRLSRGANESLIGESDRPEDLGGRFDEAYALKHTLCESIKSVNDETKSVSVEDLTGEATPFSTVVIKLDSSCASPSPSHAGSVFSLLDSNCSMHDSSHSESTFSTYNSHCYSSCSSECDLFTKLSGERNRSLSSIRSFNALIPDIVLSDESDNHVTNPDEITNEQLKKCSIKSDSFIFSNSIIDSKFTMDDATTICARDVNWKRLSDCSISSDIDNWKRNIFFGALDESEEDLCVICHKEDKWFSSSDYEGRVYFFEENSNESSWTLPETTFVTTNINENLNMGAQTTDKASEKVTNRVAKTRSMIFDDRREDIPVPQVIPRNWPQLWDGHMCVLREGNLNRTKITENGKRLRKNWASSYVVLTELFLLFFKDVKAFTAMKSGGGRPELCVDLNGALIDKGDKVSSRKNVFVISTVLGLQVLIQCDCHSQAELWLHSIQSAIKNLPSGIDSCIRIKLSKDQPKSEEADDTKKVARIGRSKSVKLKNKEASIEDLSVSSAERQTKIKARLKKFFHRRPTIEALVKKGIWKDEPVFGCYLDQVCVKEHPRVPIFVQQCIQCIEGAEENMKTDGLYRASGNLSQVQKIRLQVDQNNYSILEQEEDVHVLTGALKLFFRELKQPLIPFQLFNKSLKASTHHNRKEKLSQFRDIIKNLPTANHDTLKFLLQHLLRVTKFQEFNRMHIPNLAIVFGPTLMWPEQESLNMALDLMQQNLVIECFLVEFDHIFR